MTSEAIDGLISEFERVRRALPKVPGIKGASYEREYSILYDKLAMKGVGGRRRLRKKFRG